MLTIYLAPLNTYEECLVLIRGEAAREEQRKVIRAELEGQFSEAQKAFGRKMRGQAWDDTQIKFHGDAKEIAASWVEEKRAFRVRLFGLAEHAQIPTNGTSMVKVEWIYGNNYGSQGFGSDHYLKVSAQQYIDMAEACGLRAEYSQGAGGLDIFANCTLEDWQIVRAKPGVSVKEWIRRCWARGVNPRVMNPYLPHGLEEKYGLDYFGGYTK